MRRPHRFVPLLLGTLLTSACASVGPGYRPPTAATLIVPDAYVGAPAGAAPEALERWWSRFGDSELDALVDRALAGNLDLAVASARLVQARENVVQARAAGLPSLQASGQAARDFDGHGNTTHSYTLGADASWEADLFGGVRRSVAASRALADSAAYDLAAVRVSLIGDVATNYVQARLAQQRLVLAKQNLGYADENLQIARWRLQAGLVGSLDVEQARSSRAQVAVSIPNYEQAYSQAVFRLGVLTGQAPEALGTQLEAVAPVPSPPAAIAAGLPADTLRQRPDVRSAERTLAAETARIGVAKAQLYPALRIAGTVGTAARSIGDLTDLVTGSVFATLAQTIFAGGQLRSQVRSQEAAARGAFASYRQSVLTALEDVENALAALRASEQQRAQYAEALDAARNQAILARSNYRTGNSDFQALLEAERSLVSASDGQLVSQANATLAVIQLYRALGGGWDPARPAQE